jgi:serine/threonine-protein kinase HipA
VRGKPAGLLVELEKGKNYELLYDTCYEGPPVSLSMPVSQKIFVFNNFPSIWYPDWGLMPVRAKS